MSTIPNLHASRPAPAPLVQLPHCPQSELAALGCAMLDARHAPELNPEWFYDLRHREMALALMALASEGKPTSPDLLMQRLPHLRTLAMAPLDACASPESFPHWREILGGHMSLRRVITMAQDALAQASQPGAIASEVVQRVETAALSLGGSERTGSDLVNLVDTFTELSHDYDRAALGKSTGLETGYIDLDNLTGGFKPQQLIILAARPSVGKTALALNIAEKVSVEGGRPVGMFSLEMSGKELLSRMACSMARVDASRIGAKKITQHEIDRIASYAGKITHAPLYICDLAGLTSAQLLAKGRSMRQRFGIELLIVDYLGLVLSGERIKSRYEETTLVSNGLKRLAKELNIPVLALCQLSRANDTEGRDPKLSDLRDSGAIEQDADVVALLHRQEGDGAQGQPVKLIVGKNRSGRVGNVNLTFIPATCRFELAARVSQTS